MGRCRPRGSGMQRAVGRCVGKGLRVARNNNSYYNNSTQWEDMTDEGKAIYITVCTIFFIIAIIFMASI